MKLKILRFIESLFSIPSAFFGDWADSIDTQLHADLRKAMKDIRYRTIGQPQSKDSADNSSECAICGGHCSWSSHSFFQR